MCCSHPGLINGPDNTAQQPSDCFEMPRAIKETCDLCCDTIRKEQHSLKCEGDCSCVVHRYCAGVTRTYYDALCKSSSPFVCQFCSLKTTNAVIQQLQTTIKSLKTELAAVKNLPTSHIAGPVPPPPSSSYVAVATATNLQDGRRHPRTQAQQRKPAKLYIHFYPCQRYQHS